MRSANRRHLAGAYGLTPARGASPERSVMMIDKTEETKLQNLQDAIEPAWQQAENGECVVYDMQSIIDELDQK